MKNERNHSNDGRLYEQLRQPICLTPAIHSFSATGPVERLSHYSAAYTRPPAMIHLEPGISTVAVGPVAESALMQKVKGIVRSFVFLNWIDHA